MMCLGDKVYIGAGNTDNDGIASMDDYYTNGICLHMIDIFM